MRFFAVLALIVGGVYYGRAHIEKKHQQGLVLLEIRAQAFAAGLAEALASNVEATPEDISDHLSKFTDPSGKIAGIPAAEFWLQVQEEGSLDVVDEKSFARKEYLFRAGPWQWTGPQSRATVWAKNINGNLGIGFLHATTTARGVGIPSEASFQKLLDIMRQVDKIQSTVLYHGKPLRVEILIQWIWKKGNWFIDPSKPGALEIKYRPQQRLE
ncbi:MAG: hypothetical protein HY547_10335 [Elusimicrobia bacterium]|nr:hypothetical protein [Elusimicrobiota bacterium]